jgi:hypothetical protein
VSGNKTYTSDGPFDVTATIVASDGRTTTVAETAYISTITAVGQSISATMGESFTGVVATFTDSVSGTTASEYSATIDWGDGNTSAGTIASDGDGGYTVAGTNTYSAYGNLTPIVTISKGDPGDSQASGDAQVAALATPTLTQASLTTGNTSATLVLNWGDTNADGHTAVQIEEEAPGGNFQLIDNFPVATYGTSAPLTLTLAAGENYQFRARAIATGLSSQYSPQIDVETNSSPVSSEYETPSAGVSVGSITLASTGEMTIPVTLTGNATFGSDEPYIYIVGSSQDDPYNLSGIGAESTFVIESTSGDTYTLIGYPYPTVPAPGATYAAQLQWGAGGQPFASPTFNISAAGTRNNAPTGMAVTSNLDGSYTANWSYADSGPVVATSFAVFEIQPSGQPAEVKYLSVNSAEVPTTASYSCNFNSDGSLGNVTSSTQFFVVAGLQYPDEPPVGDSPYSNFAEANLTVTAPTAPGNLTAHAFYQPPNTSVSDNSVSLEWDNDSNSESEFDVWREDLATGANQQIATLSADTTSYVDKELEPGEYTYYIIATNSTGESSSNLLDVNVNPPGYLVAFDGSRDTPPTNTTIWNFYGRYGGSRNYYPGVASEGNTFQNAINTAFAFDGFDNVDQAYNALVTFYQNAWNRANVPIDLVGYSRGAFQAVALENMIVEYGIPDLRRRILERL